MFSNQNDDEWMIRGEVSSKQHFFPTVVSSGYCNYVLTETAGATAPAFDLDPTATAVTNVSFEYTYTIYTVPIYRTQRAGR